MIELRYETPAAWAERAVAEPLTLLSDHAHCELRAASSAQGLITKNPENAELVESMSRLALEEMRHFRRVVDQLERMGGGLRYADANPYMEELLSRSRPSRGSVLLDRLLVAGLIERRSLERFELLATAAAGSPLGELYADLAPSEAGHATLFVRLAETVFPPAKVAARLDRLAALEGEVVEGLAFHPRIHSGVAEAR